MPGTGGLLLPRCEPPFDNTSHFAPPGSFCLPGEQMPDLADHTGIEGDYRIVFYHTDHLGTPRVLTDEIGQIISKHSLYPYGEEAPGPWAIADSSNSHWFTGHERDTGNGADYMLSRYYSNFQARFRTPDSIGIVSSSYDLSNAYSYVGDSPLIFVDPSGNIRTSTALYCTGSIALGAVSAITGFLAVVDAAAPEPVLTKTAAVVLWRVSVSSYGLARTSLSACRDHYSDDSIVQRCLAEKSEDVCREAAATCLYLARKGDAPAECGRVAELLEQMQQAKTQESPTIPRPRPGFKILQ